MRELNHIGNMGIVMVFLAMAFSVQLSGCAVDESETVASSDWLLGSSWRDRLSGSPDVHLVSLPPNLSSYREAWVYQFGTGGWPSSPHNMECGPACIQIMERLTGRDSVDCTYVASVPGCDDYPNVHSECRAVGVCGADRHLRGSSWLGTGTNEVSDVLEELGYETRVYHRSTTRVSLSIVKNAVLGNHPIIVALSPRTYQSETGFGSGVDSHWVAIVGFGPVCENLVYGPDHPERIASGFVYMLDPGWSCGGQRCGAMACISEEMFNRALDAESDPSTYSAVEVIRPGYEAFPSATWYPPGTLLHVDGEYYHITQPEPITGTPRLRHASLEGLHANRVSVERAIEAPRAALSCMDSLGELDATRRFREYREPGGAIYLVDTVDRVRAVFLNLDAYLTQDGREEWRSATASEIATWSRYRRGEVGLGPGTLVASDAPGASSVWVVSINESGRVRLPIFNERAARIYGYDISGPRPRAFVRVHHADLDRLAGPVGPVLTEEMSRDCHARRCLAAVDCFSTGPSSIGGGDEGVGNGACTEGDCASEPMSAADAGTPTPDAGPPPGTLCDCAFGWRCESGVCREVDLDGDGYLGSLGDCNPESARVHPGAAEICNGFDDNCDGVADEGIDLTSDPNNCGSCNAICVAATCVASVCVPDCVPSSETCNGLDDDCDSVADDGVPDLITINACGLVTERCTSGAMVRISGRDPVAETCNGLDDNCNGTVDDGIAPIACYTTCDYGTRSCVGGSFGTCSARTPSPEVCNGFDDDCDRLVDEGCPPVCVPRAEVCNGFDDNCNGTVDDGLTEMFSNACGSVDERCISGVMTRVSGRDPVAESCNNVDDDCDGLVDRLVVYCPTPCGTGTQICVSGAWSGCTPPYVPSAEVCNGFDDNCDGRIDEGACAPPPDPNLVRIRLASPWGYGCPGGWKIRLWLAYPSEESEPGTELVRSVSRRDGLSAVTLWCDGRTPQWYVWSASSVSAFGSGIFSELSMGGVDLRSSTMICEDPCSPGTGIKPIIMWDPAQRGRCPTTC